MTTHTQSPPQTGYERRLMAYYGELLERRLQGKPETPTAAELTEFFSVVLPDCDLKLSTGARSKRKAA